MAFDQNNIPKDLRPINVARINAEESRISNQPRTAEGIYANPTRSDITSSPSVPVYLVPAATSDAKIVGLNSGNPSPVIVPAQSVAVRGPCISMPVGAPVTSPSLSISPSGCYQGPNLSVRNSTSSNEHVADEVVEDPAPSKKVKFLCSFGGKILPRPSDGMLRYVGGQTRIITVRRDVTCSDLVHKMADACGHHVVMKYQLPDEDLDALVSVSCPDDLDNMMEEYEKLLERSPDGSVKLRVFLFSSSELDSSALMQFGDLQDSSQKYVDAVNGVMEVVGGGGMARKESIASATSTQNSDISVADANDTSLLGQDVTGPHSSNVPSTKMDNTTIPDASGGHVAPGPSHIMSPQPDTSLEKTILHQPTVGYDLQQSVVKASTPIPYLHGLMDAPQVTISNTEYQKVPSHLIYTNPAQVATPSKPLVLPSQYHDNVTTVVPQRFIPAVHMTMAPPSSNMSINPTMFPIMQSPHLVIPEGYNAYQAQVPGGIAGYGWNPVLSPQEHVPLSMPCPKVTPPENVQRDCITCQKQRKDDCNICQKQLPHAHSDMVGQEQTSVAIPDVNNVFHNLCLDEIARLQPINKVVSPAEVAGVSKNFEAQCENQRIVVDHPKNLSPQSAMGLAGEVQTTSHSVATCNVIQSRSDDIVQNLVSPLSLGIEEVLANKPVKCEKVVGVSPLIVADPLSREVAKDYPEILCAAEKSRVPTDHAIKNDIFDQPPQKLAGEDLLLNNAFSKPTPILEATATNAMVSPNDLETVFANKNVQRGMTSSNLSGNSQESTSSVYSNQDPWSFLQESHQAPPMPSKIATKKEASAPRDPFPCNLLGEGTESTQSQLLNPVFHTCREDNSEQALSNKALPDFIKQEPQATAEEMTPSGLQVQLSLTSADLSADLSDSDANDEKELQNNIDAVIQAKVEGMNVKSEKSNLALPLSDGLGRLQIIKNNDLEELRELGSGTFGTVYHGKWRGTDVAIKRINNRCFAGKPSEQERMIDDFWNEAIKLGGLHHPNVVAFYGVVLDGPGGSVATVTEYMVNGSLRTALQKNERALDKRKRLLISMDVAFGMEYLHSRNIVHFDLKSDNLLVNLRDPHRPICKVGDLGLSKVKCQTLISGGVRGTLPWMAPELLNGSSSLVSDKVDVFSFGIVMWELLTGEEPYTDLHYGAIIGGIVSNTLRPSIPDHCDPDWRLLMEKCWSPEPSERPSFTQITDELRSMAAKIPSKGHTSASNTKTHVQVI